MSVDLKSFLSVWEDAWTYSTVSVGAITVLVVVEVTSVLCVCVVVETLVEVVVIVVTLTAVEVVLSVL